MIGLAVLRTDQAVNGTVLEVAVEGGRSKATVTDLSIHDPDKAQAPQLTLVPSASILSGRTAWYGVSPCISQDRRDGVGAMLTACAWRS